MIWINATPPGPAPTVTVIIDWDDGYITYLNGVPVSSENAPDSPDYDQPAPSSSHEACCTCTPEPIDLSAFLDLLRPGVNVLALQVHNHSLSSSDFIFVPQLSGVK